MEVSACEMETHIEAMPMEYCVPGEFYGNLIDRQLLGSLWYHFWSGTEEFFSSEGNVYPILYGMEVSACEMEHTHRGHAHGVLCTW